MNPNLAARKLLSPEQLGNPASYPQVTERLYPCAMWAMTPRRWMNSCDAFATSSAVNPWEGHHSVPYSGMSVAARPRSSEVHLFLTAEDAENAEGRREKPTWGRAVRRIGTTDFTDDTD